MKKFLTISAGLFAGMAMMFAAAPAMARVDVDLNIGVPIGPVYAPAPVYVQPQPVYMPPPPVYVQPGPVYVQPRPYYGERYYRHRHYDHRHYYDHDRGHGRGHGYGHDRH